MGFVDDAAGKDGVTIGGLPILGTLDWIHSCPLPDMHYVIAVAETRVKRRIVERFAGLGLPFISAIHSSVILAGGVQIEPGAILNAGAVVAYDTHIDAHSMINLNATVGHDCRVERYCTIAPGANVGGRVRLGEGSHVGMNATVSAGLVVGEWSSIGPGSVVIRDVMPGQHLFGNPARHVPTRTLV
jgi:sugar O-acyltransferase (sialic acid O-acetyltransferase NeuD family)